MMVMKPMSYAIDIKNKAKRLRNKGYSLREIATKLGISVSTTSIWVGNIALNTEAQQRLQTRKILGQYKSAQKIKQKSELKRQQYENKAKITLSHIKYNRAVNKLTASILLWTEGSKSAQSYISFINSDPLMIKTFLYLIRNSFSVEENKFRALIHMHEYHNEKYLFAFWQKVTRLPQSLFSKSYIKPHTGKRIRDNYMGSLRIRYYDAKIALELRAIYNTFAKSLGT
jgi:transcriptional regulator with XRE-family HTH domain